MSWQSIEGHDDVVEQFRRRLKSGRLASTFLFVGPSGIGKRTFAQKLGGALLCLQRQPGELDPCGRCVSCTHAAAGTHPDILIISKPEDRTEIPISLLIGPKERRMEEGLCYDLGLRPFMSDRRIAIIDDADALNEEGANALLKTLEEPPPRSVLILVGTSADRQLPTIRSRAQIVRFRPLEPQLVARLLVTQGIVADTSAAERLARLSEGSLQRALELADPAYETFRDELFQMLAETDWDSVALARRVVEFVDAAGKEAPPRRARAQLVVDFAIDFYRSLARQLSAIPPSDDPKLAAVVVAAAKRWPWNAETAAACVERCLDTQTHIARNAYLPVVLECWIDELAQLLRGRAIAAW